MVDHPYKRWAPQQPGGCPTPAAPGTANVVPPGKKPRADVQASRFREVAVPMWAANVNPLPIATARNVQIRVHVRNVGPVPVFLGDVVNDLSNPGGPTGAVVRLPIGDRDVFILAPDQTLYTLAAGGGGIISVAQSDDGAAGTP